MNRFRKSLALIPIIIAYLICDKTWADFVAMMVGGFVLWVPYWLAWWLSDGFSIFNTPCNDKNFGYIGYKYGLNGYGFYVDEHFIHR